MSRISLLLLALYVSCGPLLAQPRANALRQALRQHPPDSQRVRLYWELAEVLTRQSPAAARAYARSAERLADSLGSPAAQARAALALGELDWRQGHYLRAEDHFLYADSLFLQLGDSLGFARAHHDLGRVAWRLGNFLDATSQVVEASQIRQRHGTPAERADSYYWLGILSADQFEYETARHYYQLALQLAEQLQDTSRQADILNHIGRSWRKQNVFEKAFAAHQRSLVFYQALQDRSGISDYHNNVGSIYRRQGNYPEALEHFFIALQIQTELDDREGMADGYNDIGTTFCQYGRYPQAINYLEKGLKVAREAGLLDDVRYAYHSLAAAYDSIGDYQQALRYTQRMLQVKDSLFDLNKNRELHRLQVRYETDRQRQQIELLTQARALEKAERSRFRVIAGGGALLLLLGLGFFYYRFRIQAQSNRTLAYKNRLIALEKQRSDELLRNILPAETAEELKREGRTTARSYDIASVLFVDFRNFTKIAETLTPRELVQELHHCFEAFDLIVHRHRIEKIKTIGDAYMAVGGLPVADPLAATRVVRVGLEIQAFLRTYNAERRTRGEPEFQARIGIHTGPVVAGIVGIKKFAYDIWGDTVNIASRIEQAGQIGKVNISHHTYLAVQHEFICHHRGKISVKNKGLIDMYFVEWEI